MDELLWAVRARPAPTPDARTISRRRPSTPADITSGRRELAAAAQRWAGGDAALEQLQLAFEELVSNAVRHGLPPVEATARTGRAGSGATLWR